MVGLPSVLFADLPGKWALGISGGGGYLSGAGFGSTAVTFVLPPLPLFWELDFRFSSVPYTDLNVDYLIFNNVLSPAVLRGTLRWQIGLGAHTGVGLAPTTTYFSLAGRLVLGLSWQFKIIEIHTFEIFLKLVPSLGFQLTPLSGVYGGIGIGAGIRFWINENKRI
ncbi:MAG: hypothetical protein LBO67_09285 [Spirochaetaceae bacterium]|jgi:hypothetical protein|nr:hypothetical protein [Spirochaetaceae bacterium]